MFLLLYSCHVRGTTRRLHTKLYKFRWNCLPNNAAMKIHTDLNLGDVFWPSIIYHIPDSWLNLLTGYDFYFRWQPPIKIYWVKTSCCYSEHWDPSFLFQNLSSQKCQCRFYCSLTNVVKTFAMNVQETNCAMRPLPHPPPLRTHVKRYVIVTCGMAQCFRCVFC